MLDRIITDLLQNQNSDGGWGALRGKRSNTEATSLAIAALKALAENTAAENRKRGIDWLVRQQNKDHSWPLNETVKEGSWTTALAITALSDTTENSEHVLAAARWLLEQEGSKPGILAEIVLWVTGKSRVNKLDKDLIGWSWVPISFSWVEPTSYALIALKKQRARLAGTARSGRCRPERGEARRHTKHAHQRRPTTQPTHERRLSPEHDGRQSITPGLNAA